MKKLALGLITFLMLLFVAPLVTPADAQVAVRIGPSHHYHHYYHHRHAYYRHGHRYYR